MTPFVEQLNFLSRSALLLSGWNILASCGVFLRQESAILRNYRAWYRTMRAPYCFLLFLFRDSNGFVLFRCWIHTMRSLLGTARVCLSAGYFCFRPALEEKSRIADYSIALSFLAPLSACISIICRWGDLNWFRVRSYRGGNDCRKADYFNSAL